MIRAKWGKEKTLRALAIEAGMPLAAPERPSYARLERDRKALIEMLRSVIEGDDLEKYEAKLLLNDLGEL